MNINRFLCVGSALKVSLDIIFWLPFLFEEYSYLLNVWKKKNLLRVILYYIMTCVCKLRYYVKYICLCCDVNKITLEWANKHAYSSLCAGWCGQEHCGCQPRYWTVQKGFTCGSSRCGYIRVRRRISIAIIYQQTCFGFTDVGCKMWSYNIRRDAHLSFESMPLTVV